MVMIAPRGAKRSEREDQAIKGPGIRLDLDVRRVWRCPSCQRVLKTAGHITGRRCPIDGAFMKLDDSAQRAARRFSFPPISIDDDETVVVEEPPDQPMDDDDDRPRKQSRKQKRRRQRKSDDPEHPSQPDDSTHDNSSVNGIVEPTGPESHPADESESAPADPESQATDQ